MNVVRHEDVEKDLRNLRRFSAPLESLEAWERFFSLKGLRETPGVDRDMCYSNIARGERENGNPEICRYIENNESRYHCYSIIAIDKRDPSICEKYFPTDAVLIQEGVNPADYSKSKCIVDAEKGYFN